MSENRMPKNRGFTLIELMVAIAILAITLGVAVPNFQEFVSRNRLAAATNELISALALARSEAVKRATPVTVASSDWSGGWQVFVDVDKDGVPPDDDDTALLRVYQLNTDGAPLITGDAGFISYLPSGSSEGGSSFEVCKSGMERVISISNTGRVSTTSGSCT